MLSLVLWFASVQVIGIFTFPIAYYLFPRLYDRGYAISKVLGILLIGYLSWILSVVYVVPSTQFTIFIILVLIASISFWYFYRNRSQFYAFLNREKTTIIVIEAVFFVVFVAWAFYRSYDPAINHTEQPMDFAFLNASIRSIVGHPDDPWLSGQSVNYYYFGYWIMGTLSKLTAIQSNYSYNLSLALTAGLSASGIFGIVYNMSRSEGGKKRFAVVGGFAAVFLLVFAGNLEGVLEFVHANGMGNLSFWRWIGIDGISIPASTLTDTWYPEGNWWWWRATRVISTFDGVQQIDYVIHEFPSFSQILGDLHPHVMSLPVIMLFLTFCWSFLTTSLENRYWLKFRFYAVLSGMCLSLGCLVFTNMWDLPAFVVMLLMVIALKIYSTFGLNFIELSKGIVLLGGIIIGVSSILILPYLLTFTSQVDGVAPVGDYVSMVGNFKTVVSTTHYHHMFIVWGLFIITVVPFLVLIFWQTTVQADWRKSAFMAVFIGVSPYLIWAVLHLMEGGVFVDLVGRFVHVLPFTFLIGISVYSMMWLQRYGSSAASKTFAISLAVLGLFLVMGPELLYVDDSFGGYLERMNTVFKLYYQAWAVFAIAAGFAICNLLSLRSTVIGWKLLLYRSWSFITIVTLLCGAYYTIAAVAAKGSPFSDVPTLDGLSFIEHSNLSEYHAIEAIKAELDSESHILEAVGDGYSQFGRISSSTGVPTVLGWMGHEIQWRGFDESFEERKQDVSVIYQTQDISEAKSLMDKYGVNYVYVGHREIGKYGPDGLSKFAAFMDTIFSEGEVRLYRMPR